MIEKMKPCQTKAGWGRCGGTDFSIEKKRITDTNEIWDITCNKCKEVTTVTVNPKLLIEQAMAEEWNAQQAAKSV